MEKKARRMPQERRDKMKGSFFKSSTSTVVWRFEENFPKLNKKTVSHKTRWRATEKKKHLLEIRNKYREEKNEDNKEKLSEFQATSMSAILKNIEVVVHELDTGIEHKRNEDGDIVPVFYKSKKKQKEKVTLSLTWIQFRIDFLDKYLYNSYAKKSLDDVVSTEEENKRGEDLLLAKIEELKWLKK